jgi:hypothetical protein
MQIKKEKMNTEPHDTNIHTLDVHLATFSLPNSEGDVQDAATLHEIGIIEASRATFDSHDRKPVDTVVPDRSSPSETLSTTVGTPESTSASEKTKSTSPNKQKKKRLMQDGSPTREGKSAGQEIPAPSPYRFYSEGIVKRKGSGDNAIDVPVTNFVPKSVRPVIEDDGLEAQRSYEIELEMRGVSRRGRVSERDFPRMQWPAAILGFRATVFPRMSEDARAAVQLHTPLKESVTTYVATGWRNINGKPMFLHSSGAVGDANSDAELHAILKENLRAISLPDPPSGEELKEAIRASLGLLDVSAPSVSIPLLAAIYRAPLGELDFAMHLHGLTGSMKTTLALLAQQHFGKNFTDKTLPAYWSATSNYIQEHLFAAKDTLTVVDDFVPKGPRPEMDKWQQKFDEVIRSASDGATRGRLTSSGEERPAHGPRGLILSTGEVVPNGESALARVINIEVTPDSVNLDNLNRRQADADAGLYAKSVSGYLLWISKRFPNLRATVEQRIRELRRMARIEGQHLRTPENLANLVLGIETFLQYALESEAITEPEANAHWEKAWTTVMKLGAAQNQQQQSEDPVRESLRLLASAEEAGLLVFHDLKDEEEEGHPKPNSSFVGWRKDEGSEWLCDPNQVYSTLNRLWMQQGRTLPLKKADLFRRMSDRGFLPISDEPNRYTVKRTINGLRKRVLVLTQAAFTKTEEETANQTEGGGSALAVPVPAWRGLIVQ